MMNSNKFRLDPQLENDTVDVCDLQLCKLLLMNDSQYPWLILVPQRSGIREIIQLSDNDQQLLWRESARVSQGLQDLFEPDKLNVAALGNVVAQLHLHHIARFEQDKAWPKPVWAQFDSVAYSSDKLESMLLKLRNYFC